MALIKCTECGHMISDKASKCPKCGCPIMKGNIEQHNVNTNQQPMHQQPVYYGDSNRGNNNKWLYAVIALLVAAIAGGGYWLYSQSSGDKEIRQFVEQFAKAVETGDSLTIRNLYPDSNADSLVFNYDKNNIQIDRKENEWIVKEADDVVLIIVKNEDNTIQIKESYGIFSYPDSLLTVAKATGWYDKKLNDIQNAERLSDEDFIKWLKEHNKDRIKANVKISKKSQYLDDNIDNAINVYAHGCDFKCTHTVIISNENSFVIPSKDYHISVIHKSDDDYDYFQTNKKRIEGKSIPANGTVSYTWQDIHFEGTWSYEDDVMLVYNPSLINLSELSVFTGTEYEKYELAKK